jgi:Mrp family chromosome partitioning ATPase
MLIECDLYCPSLAAHFRTAAGPGLCDILAGRLLGDIARVVHEPAPRLHVITAGRPVSDTQELLASNRMTALLAAVRARYDLVVLDTPPVLPVPDALVLARHAEATLMVVRWDSTARHAVQDAMRQLHEYRARLLGVIMTQVDMRRAARAAGRMAYAFSFNGTYYGRPVGGQRLVMQGGALGRALILLTAGLLRARGAGRPVARG